MKIIATTCDKHAWTLKPFAYLFNKYWSGLQEVTILGETPPDPTDFTLPKNFTFHSCGTPWPKKDFSEKIIEYLQSIPDEYFIWMLDDYWLVRTVDLKGIQALTDYMKARPVILRMDLTTDRLYAGGMKDKEFYRHYDIIAAPGSEYEMSLQAGIWNRDLLLKVLQVGWSPWDIELEGTTIVNDRKDIHVAGTRQYPVRYINGLKSGEEDVVNTEGMPEEHIKHITDAGWLK